MTSNVSDHRSNSPEQIEFAVKIIGKSKHRRLVFDAVYFGKKAFKTVKEISAKTKLSEKRVLEEGKKLADNGIIKQAKKDKSTAYSKDAFYSANKSKIRRFLDDPKKLGGFPTKRNVSVKVSFESIRIPTKSFKIKAITIDDIDSFRKVRGLYESTFDISVLSETQFKNGVLGIIGERGVFKDWGGEVNDLLTTRVKYKGARISAAFAFKGPGTKGKLTIAKMGKNGDQVLRLFKSPADLFILQYWSEIDQRVIEEVESHAKIASLSNFGKEVLYCVIDGQDSARIVQAYREFFNSSKKRK